jgi:hypothetical protein
MIWNVLLKVVSVAQPAMVTNSPCLKSWFTAETTFPTFPTVRVIVRPEPAPPVVFEEPFA